MSYILDALRRADAERERGAVPSLCSQTFAGPTDEPLAPRRRAGGVWIALGVALGLALPLGGAVWWASRRDAAQPAELSASPERSPPQAVAGVAPAAARPLAEVRSAAPVSEPPPREEPAAAATTPAPQGAAGMAQGRPAAQGGRADDRSSPAPATSGRGEPAPQRRGRPAAAPAASADGTGTRPRDGLAAVPAAASVAPASPAPASPAPERVPLLQELPPELKQHLPSLAIGGSVYSPQRADRVVIVNGRPYQEGDRLTPELTLEQIQPRQAVFRFRGQSFAIGY